MEIHLRPGEVARRLGLTVNTHQRMDRAERVRVVRTTWNQRRIPESEVHRLMGELEVREPLLYARVSSHGQKGDLERQMERRLRLHPGVEVHVDIRSGLQFDRPGFLSLIKAVQERRVSRVVVVHEDRLARFGVDMFHQVFAAYGTSLEVMEPKPAQTPEH